MEGLPVTDTESHPTLSESAQHHLAAGRDAFLSSHLVRWPGGAGCILLLPDEAAMWGLKDGDLVLSGVPVVIDYPWSNRREGGQD
jgi:hypothetical protein